MAIWTTLAPSVKHVWQVQSAEHEIPRGAKLAPPVKVNALKDAVVVAVNRC